MVVAGLSPRRGGGRGRGGLGAGGRSYRRRGQGAPARCWGEKVAISQIKSNLVFPSFFVRHSFSKYPRQVAQFGLLIQKFVSPL